MIDSLHHQKTADHAAPHEPRRWLGYMLNQLAWRFRNETAAALEPLGLTPPMLRLLGLIAADQPVTQVQLAARSGFDRTSIMRQLDQLEGRGLAERQPCAKDRRAHNVMLTTAGAEALAAGSARAASVEAAILSPLAPAEAELFAAIVSQLAAPHVKICPDPDQPEEEAR